MYIEVKKKSNGKYEVIPNANPSGGGSPLNSSIPGFNDTYGVILFLDNEDNPLSVDNVATFDYSVVYTIFYPGDYNNYVYRRGTDFDELMFEGDVGEDSRIVLYKNSEYVNDVAFGSTTSTSDFTIAHIIGL